MADDFKNGRDADEKALNSLIRAARSSPEGQSKRPDDGTIQAYLLGSANEEQKAAVMRCLEQSASFRREMLEMAEDIDALSSSESEFGQPGSEEPVPDFEDFLYQHGEMKRAADKIVDPVKPVRSNVTRIWVPVLAAAALIIAVGIPVVKYALQDLPTVSQVVPAPLHHENVEPHLLVPNLTRLPGELAETTGFPSSREAALDQCRNMLKFEGGQLEVDTLFSQPVATESEEGLRLVFVDSAGDTVESFGVSNVATEEADSLRVWILGMPSRDLYSADLIDRSALVTWLPEMSGRGCIVFTGRLNDEHRSFGAATFHLK